MIFSGFVLPVSRDPALKLTGRPEILVRIVQINLTDSVLSKLQVQKNMEREMVNCELVFEIAYGAQSHLHSEVI